MYFSHFMIVFTQSSALVSEEEVEEAMHTFSIHGKQWLGYKNSMDDNKKREKES